MRIGSARECAHLTGEQRMKVFPPEMLQATQLTSAGRLSEATRVIQEFLAGRPGTADDEARPALIPPTLDLVAESVTTEPRAPAPESPSTKTRTVRADAKGKTVFDHLKTLRPLQPAHRWQPSDLSPP